MKKFLILLVMVVSAALAFADVGEEPSKETAQQAQAEVQQAQAEVQAAQGQVQEAQELQVKAQETQAEAQVPQVQAQETQAEAQPVQTEVQTAQGQTQEAQPVKAETPAAQPEAAKTIEAYSGQEITINLVSNPSTGYQWKLADPVDETMLKLASSAYVAPATDLIGAPGKEVWKFQTLRAGEALIAFKYVRPWEAQDESAPKGIFKVIIKEAPEVKQETTMMPAAPNTITGKVTSIAYADLFTKPNPDMTVATEDGKEVKFIITPSVVVMDVDGTVLSLRQVDAGDDVSVNYRSTEDVNEVVGIKFLTKQVVEEETPSPEK